MLWSAFLLGLVGSLHCVGMCGPLTLLLPNDGQFSSKFVFGRISYNLGRVVTYSILGATAGFFGEKVKKELGRVSYLGMEVFVFFDNSLKGETITMTNHFIVPEISINLDENLENGFSTVYGLQGNSKDWYVNINGHILYIDSWTYLKYKFIVIKKLDQKEYKILFTNHPNYNFSKVDFEEIVKTYQEYPAALGVGGYITNETQWYKVASDSIPKIDEFYDMI